MDQTTIPSDTVGPGGVSVPTVSIVIPAYTMERWPLIKKAVESARRQTVAIETVVLCVDNNADLLLRAQEEWRDVTGTPVLVLANRHDDHLSGRDMHHRVHGETRRFGAGSVRNTAAETVTSDIVAFMDDDAWAEPDWIEQLLPLYREPSIMAVGGAPLPYYETSRPAWYHLNFDWVFGCAYEGLPTVAAPLLRLIGANMSVRRGALVAVGGFQEIDFDDLDMCMRLAARYGNDGIYYAPRAVVHHYVPDQRVSWSYFCRRCYFVNRGKVRVFRRVGPSASLAAERAFVLHTVRRRVVTDLKRGFAGDGAAFLSLAAMFAGIGFAAAGRVHGMLDQALSKDAA